MIAIFIVKFVKIYNSNIVLKVRYSHKNTQHLFLVLTFVSPILFDKHHTDIESLHDHNDNYLSFEHAEVAAGQASRQVLA